MLPGVDLLRRYERPWLRVDAVGGLTVGAMLVPQAMAYAELAGLRPEYGFYAALAPLVVYAVVGTSRHLGVGPEPGTAILAAAAVGGVAEGDDGRYVTLMAALALLVGAICVVGAAARLGFLATVLSKPVLVGYITGVGLTLLSSQIAAFTGADIDGNDLLGRFADLATRLGTVDTTTTALGTGTLAVILVLRRVASQAPAALIGVVGASAVVAIGGLDVALIGAIPAGLPSPGLPTPSAGDVAALLPAAAGIALVGYTDNVLTARSIAARHGYRIDPNQELLALGLTNVASGLSHGFPMSSSASRTAVPASLGSKTQVVSLVAAGFLVVTLLAARDLLAEIPRAALAAVIVAAAIAIVDVAGYRSLWRVNREEAALAGLAALGVVVFGVLVGVVVAVTLSMLVALHRIARPHDAVLGDHPDLDGWVDVDAYPEAVTEPGLLVYRFDAPLFFVNAERFSDRVEQVLAENPGAEEWLVLDFEGVGAVDASALDALAELLERVNRRNVAVIGVARANDDVCAALERAGLAERVRLFPTINGAVRAYRERAR